MSDLGYLVWLIATAIAILVVLTVGTLAAAGLIGRDEERSRGAVEPDPAPRESRSDDHRHAA